MSLQKDGAIDRSSLRAPPVPPPPPAEGAAPATPATSAAPAMAPVPHTGNPPIMAPAPTPPAAQVAPPPARVATPPPPPPVVPAAPPAQNGAAAALGDDTLVRVTLEGGVPADVKLSDLKREYGQGKAAEKRLQAVNRERIEQADAIRRGEALRDVERIKTINPQEAARRLAELTGIPLGVNEKQDGDDGLDPAQRDIQRRLAAMEQVTDGYKRSQSEAQAAREAAEIDRQVRSYPLFAADERKAQLVSALVATQWLQSGRTASVGEIVAQVHAIESDYLTARTQQERDTRAATAASLPVVTPDAGTPAMTDNSIAPAPKGLFQKASGIRRDFSELAARVFGEAR